MPTGQPDSGPMSSAVPVSSFPCDKGYDTWDIVATYIFQNSEAKRALLHHDNLIRIHEGGDTDDLVSLLVRHKPRIEVDEDGVGRIVFQELQQLEEGLEMSTPDDLYHLPERQLRPTADNSSPRGLVSTTPHDEGYDSWDIVATYIFQNSEAKRALLHRDDLIRICEGGDTDDLVSLLVRHKPRIEVDEDGVGRIVFREPHQLSGFRSTGGLSEETLTRATARNDEPSPVVHPDPDSSIVPDVNIPTWKHLCSRDFLPHEYISLVKAIFTSKDEVKVICNLRGGDAQAAIDVIHKTLDLPNLPPQLRVKCLSALSRICSRQALFPRSLKIPMCYDQSGAPRYRGGFADVWKGEYQGCDVAVKVLRVYSTSNLPEITKMFCKEVVIWNALRHPNVLPLLGVIANEGQFAMVSEWMTNGNINEFIKAHGEVNRFELLQDVAIGLIYIHSLEMIHGDLKGLNILIDKNGRARLADFGLLKFVSNPTYFTASSTASTGGTVRWMSPELLDPEQYDMDNDHPTKESDCYALGMVIYETLTGQPPFALLKVKDHIFKEKVLRGERPGRPEGAIGALFMDELWEMLGRCWASQAQSRPKIGDVLECLKQVSDTWKPLPVNEDVRVDDDGWDLTAESLLTKLTLNAS